MSQITLSTREKYIKPYNFLGLLDFKSSSQFLVQIITLFALSDTATFCYTLYPMLSYTLSAPELMREKIVVITLNNK